MKLLITAFTSLLLLGNAQAQDFASQLNTARSAYNGGKLEDARFAMQQMMQELDMLTGKEILAVLPLKMDTMNVVAKEDNVSGASGFAGVIIHRQYGANAMSQNKGAHAELEIITNSPTVGFLNGLLSVSFIANNPDQKIIKVNGYKAMVQKTGSDEGEGYEVQLPINNNLISLKTRGYSQDKTIALANALPVAEIAKRLQ